MKGYRFVDAPGSSCHFVCALCANLSCLGSVVVIICCLTTSLVINYHALLHCHWLQSETRFGSRIGYAAQGLRHAFLPAIVSTSGRIHGELLRLLFNLADKKTSNSLEALGEASDVESEVYCRRRSGNFWRMRAALGLACAQAATLGTQVVGRPRSRPRYAARPRH